jgi:hypothetical protein
VKFIPNISFYSLFTEWKKRQWKTCKNEDSALVVAAWFGRGTKQFKKLKPTICTLDLQVVHFLNQNYIVQCTMYMLPWHGPWQAYNIDFVHGQKNKLQIYLTNNNFLLFNNQITISCYSIIKKGKVEPLGRAIAKSLWLLWKLLLECLRSNRQAGGPITWYARAIRDLQGRWSRSPLSGPRPYCDSDIVRPTIPRVTQKV